MNVQRGSVVDRPRPEELHSRLTGDLLHAECGTRRQRGAEGSTTPANYRSRGTCIDSCIGFLRLLRKRLLARPSCDDGDPRLSYRCLGISHGRRRESRFRSPGGSHRDDWFVDNLLSMTIRLEDETWAIALRVVPPDWWDTRTDELAAPAHAAKP
jgi:hypothetical protein